MRRKLSRKEKEYFNSLATKKHNEINDSANLSDETMYQFQQRLKEKGEKMHPYNKALCKKLVQNQGDYQPKKRVSRKDEQMVSIDGKNVKWGQFK